MSVTRDDLLVACRPLLERCTFGGEGVQLAFSGGPDSTAALLLASATGLEVVAHHVNHHARPTSNDDEATAQLIAAQLGVEIVVHHAQVDPGPGFEARARAARLALLPEGFATGHTMDDQAETVLINLLRGAGADGLAAMEAGPRHPILDLRRAETEALCASVGLEVARDPMNEDRSLLRVQLREELIPALAEAASRDLVPLLARTASLLRDEVDLLEQLAQEAVPDPTDARQLAATPEVLARRRLRSWLRRLDGDGAHPPSLAEVERVLDVAQLRSRGTQLAGGRQVRRRDGRLRLEDPAPSSLAVVSDHSGTSAPSWAPATVGEAIITPEELSARVRELGAQITKDYADDPPLLVGVLKGAMMFMTDLSRAVELPVDVDFMAVSSYGSQTATSGVVRIIKDLEADLAGRNVVLVEDIVDSGLTLNYLLRYLKAREPKSLEVCALFVKEGVQRVQGDYAYVGFTIPKTFVVGYGLDVDERLRNLPTVYRYLPAEG